MASLRRALINVHRIINTSVAPNQSPVSALSISQHRWVSRYSTASENGDARSLDINLADEESKRRLFNRLVYRSKQRGFLELDLVLGKWVEENIHSMDENRIKALVDVLDLENPDLWKWLTSQEEAPEKISLNPVFTVLRDKVMSNLNNHSAPETRALPGQPWVRGWDDYKKGASSPIAGNQ